MSRAFHLGETVPDTLEMPAASATKLPVFFRLPIGGA